MCYHLRYLPVNVFHNLSSPSEIKNTEGCDYIDQSRDLSWLITLVSVSLCSCISKPLWRRNMHKTDAYNHSCFNSGIEHSHPWMGNRPLITLHCFIMMYSLIHVLITMLLFLMNTRTPDTKSWNYVLFYVDILRLMWNSFVNIVDIHQLPWIRDIQAWASYQIRKIVGCTCVGSAGNVFPATAG